MPELAAFYSLGLVICAITTVVFVFLIRSRRSSEPYRRLAENLKEAGLYWSENMDRVVDWSAKEEKRDRAAAEKTAAMTGSMLSVLSWAGLVFLLVIMISYRFLARSRLERRLFASSLTESKMPAEEVRRILAELDAASRFPPKFRRERFYRSLPRREWGARDARNARSKLN